MGDDSGEGKVGFEHAFGLIGLIARIHKLNVEDARNKDSFEYSKMHLPKHLCKCCNIHNFACIMHFNVPKYLKWFRNSCGNMFGFHIINHLVILLTNFIIFIVIPCFLMN